MSVFSELLFQLPDPELFRGLRRTPAAASVERLQRGGQHAVAMFMKHLAGDAKLPGGIADGCIPCLHLHDQAQIGASPFLRLPFHFCRWSCFAHTAIPPVRGRNRVRLPLPAEPP